VTSEAAARAPRATSTTRGRGPLESRPQILYAAVAVGLASAVYFPILQAMVQQWNKQPDYSHGFLVAPLAVYFAWERKNKLAKVPIEGSWLGLLPMVAGLAILTIGRLGVVYPLMRGGYIVTLMGIVVLLLGLRVFRILVFPLFFLFLMVPLPQSIVNVIAFPLQLLAAGWAVESLHLLGIPALVEGNIIHLANAELFVAEACSGLRSLMALITLGVVFAYFFRRRLAERVILVASAIPIAIVVNAFRVSLTGILTHYFGEEMATGFIHDFQGLITFSLAFVLLMAEARLLNLLWPQAPKRPRKAAPA